MPLTPGQRLDCKKRIASSLSSQTWDEIGATLNEFGIPDVEWSGSNKESYALARLEPVRDDEKLVLLDSYLHPDHAPPVPEAEPAAAFDDPISPWKGARFRLFISHVSANAAHAGALRSELAKRSIDAFVAHDSIEPTEEWVEVIEYALRTCDGCLAILAPGFRESEWCDQEVGACVARKVLVIPMEYGLMPYGFLERYQALSVAGRQEQELALAIFELLLRKEASRRAMARALVARWADSDSFDAARQNYALLQKVPADAWTQPLVDRVWEARHENRQLNEASINYQGSEQAVEQLFSTLPFTRPTESA